ncbi:unnamed protein product [Schistosoma rodhaini]|nr:unnamed protein product [Schistosoma rodhaini]
MLLFIIIFIYSINYFILYTNESFIIIDDGILRNFCQANDVCNQLNTIHEKYFLMGLNYPQLLPGKNYTNKIFWTSIVYLLPEIIKTSNTKMILRDANPNPNSNNNNNTTIIVDKQSLVSPSGILHFTNTIKLQSNLLTIKKNYSIVCELSLKGIQMMTRFKYQSFTKLFNFNYLNNNPKFDSCYNQIRAASLNECLYKCSMTEECRMIYYSKEKHVCVQMLHVYALLPTLFSRYSIAWESYIKQIV